MKFDEYVNNSKQEFMIGHTIKNTISDKTYLFCATTEDDYLLIAYAQRPEETWKSASIPFEDLLSCGITENGVLKTESGVGRAVTGGMLFGPVGALVGASTRKQQDIVTDISVRIQASNIPNNEIKLKMNFSNSIVRGSNDYAICYEWAHTVQSAISTIIEEQKRKRETVLPPQVLPVQTVPKSIATTLTELKQLLDNGLITQNEYDGLRKQALQNFVQ